MTARLEFYSLPFGLGGNKVFGDLILDHGFNMCWIQLLGQVHEKWAEEISG
jgi:hypothetical protein